MESRDTQLLSLRPKLPNIRLDSTMSPDESFQNITLRPIVKLQNDLLVAVYKNYISKHKNVFQNLTVEARLDYIDNSIQKDIKFRNALKGIIIGQFTLSEYELYIQNFSALNKRIMNIVKERLKNNLMQFENTAA